MLSKVDLQLPTPVFNVKQTRIIASSSQASTSGTNEQWTELENVHLSHWDVKGKGKRPLRLLPEKKLAASVNGMCLL